MKIEKNRHLIILRTLIKNKDDYCSSDFLAHRTMASIRTIKNDIVYLNQLLEEDGGAYIESLKSKGYRIVRKDPNQYKALCEMVNIYQIVFRTQSIEKTNRRLFILQNLLSKEAVKIDELAYDLFVSRSTLKEDIAWATSFIKSFHLHLQSIPGKGLVIQGDERDIRSAMLEVITSQYHDIDFMYPVESFYAWFHLEWYDDIRHEILKMIRESDITITDIGGKKLATYLCLCKERNEKGHLLSFNDQEMKQYKAMEEYRLANQIAQLSSIKNHIEIQQEEIYNITRMLRVIRDFDFTKEKAIESKSIQESNRLFDWIVKQLQAEYDLSIFASEPFLENKDAFASILCHILMQSRYDYLDKTRLITYTEMEDNLYSPLALEYTRLFVGALEEYFQSKIEITDVRALSGIFHHLLNGLPISYRRQRLAFFSMEGRCVATSMKEELIQQYGDYIEKADVFNLYEMRRIRFEDYDATIASWNVAYYVYPIPLVVYTGSDHRMNRKNLFNTLFIKGYPFEVSTNLKKIAQYHRDASIHHYDDMIEILANTYGKSQKQKENILQKIKKRYQSASYYNPTSGISMVFLDYKDTKKEVFAIYEPKDTVFWQSAMEIRYFVVVSLNPNRDLSFIHLMHQFLHHISRHRSSILKMKEDMPQTIDDIYIEILEDNFM